MHALVGVPCHLVHKQAFLALGALAPHNSLRLHVNFAVRLFDCCCELGVQEFWMRVLLLERRLVQDSCPKGYKAQQV